MSDESIEQPKKIKMRDFDIVHKQIALEQQKSMAQKLGSIEFGLNG
mgnify:CR=1 FL=1